MRQIAEPIYVYMSLGPYYDCFTDTAVSLLHILLMRSFNDLAPLGVFVRYRSGEKSAATFAAL